MTKYLQYFPLVIFATYSSFGTSLRKKFCLIVILFGSSLSLWSQELENKNPDFRKYTFKEWKIYFDNLKKGEIKPDLSKFTDEDWKSLFYNNNRYNSIYSNGGLFLEGLNDSTDVMIWIKLINNKKLNLSTDNKCRIIYTATSGLLEFTLPYLKNILQKNMNDSVNFFICMGFISSGNEKAQEYAMEFITQQEKNLREKKCYFLPLTSTHREYHLEFSSKELLDDYKWKEFLFSTLSEKKLYGHNGKAQCIFNFESIVFSQESDYGGYWRYPYFSIRVSTGSNDDNVSGKPDSELYSTHPMNGNQNWKIQSISYDDFFFIKKELTPFVKDTSMFSFGVDTSLFIHGDRRIYHRTDSTRVNLFIGHSGDTTIETYNDYTMVNAYILDCANNIKYLIVNKYGLYEGGCAGSIENNYYIYEMKNNVWKKCSIEVPYKNQYLRPFADIDGDGIPEFSFYNYGYDTGIFRLLPKVEKPFIKYEGGA